MTHSRKSKLHPHGGGGKTCSLTPCLLPPWLWSPSTALSWEADSGVPVARPQIRGLSAASPKRLSRLSCRRGPRPGLGRQTMGPASAGIAQRLGYCRPHPWPFLVRLPPLKSRQAAQGAREDIGGGWVGWGMKGWLSMARRTGGNGMEGNLRFFYALLRYDGHVPCYF